MSDGWEEIFRELIADFKALAEIPGELSHLMIERHRNAGRTRRKGVKNASRMGGEEVKPAWFDPETGLQNPRWAVLDECVMRQEPLHKLEESNRRYYSGPWLVRKSYICGDSVHLCKEFKKLAFDAGRNLAALPDGAIDRFPVDIRSLARNTGRLGDTPLANWLLLLHRIGWKAEPNDRLIATRWFWKGQCSVPFEETKNRIIRPDVPTNRFYSLLGMNLNVPIRLDRASVWAIEKLLNLTPMPLGTPTELPTPLVDYIDLDQAAALVNRSKKSLERAIKKDKTMPAPDVEGGGGRKHEWNYATLKPWLEKNFGRVLPSRPPHIVR